jgi:hypothetical protein
VDAPCIRPRLHLLRRHGRQIGPVSTLSGKGEKIKPPPPSSTAPVTDRAHVCATLPPYMLAAPLQPKTCGNRVEPTAEPRLLMLISTENWPIYTKQGGRQPPPQVGAITSHLGSLHTNRAAAEFGVGVIPPSLNPTPHSRATTTRSLPPRKHAARAKGGNSTLFRQGGATGGFPLTDVGLPRNTTPYGRQTDPHNGRQHRPYCHPGPAAG